MIKKTFRTLLVVFAALWFSGVYAHSNVFTFAFQFQGLTYPDLAIFNNSYQTAMNNPAWGGATPMELPVRTYARPRKYTFRNPDQTISGLNFKTTVSHSMYTQPNQENTRTGGGDGVFGLLLPVGMTFDVNDARMNQETIVLKESCGIRMFDEFSSGTTQPDPASGSLSVKYKNINDSTNGLRGVVIVQSDGVWGLQGFFSPDPVAFGCVSPLVTTPAIKYIAALSNQFAFTRASIVGRDKLVQLGALVGHEANQAAMSSATHFYTPLGSIGNINELPPLSWRTGLVNYVGFNSKNPYYTFESMLSPFN
jgi:hypothetical protein